MRGVTGEEDPSDAVLGRLPFVAVEAGEPAGVVHAVVGSQGAPGDLLDLVEFERRVVGDLVPAVPAHDPVPAVAEGRDHREGVAGAVDGEHARRALGEPDVRQEEGLDDGDAGEGQADRPAHGAAVAVRADDVGRAAGDDGAVRDADVEVDALGVLAQPHDLVLEEELHAELARPLLQQPLDLVLRGDEQVREAGGEGAQVQGEAAEEAQLGDGAAGGEQGVGEAAGVELLEGAGVHAEGAREVADSVGAPLDEGDGDVGGGEVTGEEQAGGAGADDDHAVRGRGGGGPVGGGCGAGAAHGGLLGANVRLPTPGCRHSLAYSRWPTSDGQRSLATIERGTERSQHVLAYACWPTIVDLQLLA